MKFQLFGKVDEWHYGPGGNGPEILQEFEADSIEAAIELASQKLSVAAKRSTETDDGDGSSAFRGLKAELRVIEPVWKGEIKPRSVTRRKTVIEKENVLEGIRI